jgi:glycerophosphoryl diester phosphodiesterase
MKDSRWDLKAHRSSRPIVVAHRAGNDLVALRQAERLGIPIIEADLRLFAGRVEVRHLRTLGPVPIFWDEGRLAPPWMPRLLLEQLLDEAAPSTELLLDLKGRNLSLAARVAAMLETRAPACHVSVCARNWRLLEPFQGLGGVRVIHSVGSRRQLRALRQRAAAGALEGVSIHRKLLDPAIVTWLRAHSALVLSWPVASSNEARELAWWGVDGLITERFEAIAAAVASEETLPQTA